MAIQIVRNAQGQWLEVEIDPASGRVLRVLGLARVSQVEPGFNDPDSLVSQAPAANLDGFRGGLGYVPGGERVLRQAIRDELGKNADENVAPPKTWRPLAGAHQNNRGRTIQVAVTPPTDAALRFDGVVQTPPSNGDDAEIITVVLGFQQDVNAAFIADAVAEISWGIGAAQFFAEVDWMQGTVIGIPASFLRVSLRIDSVATDIPVKGLFSAALAYHCSGSRGLASPARRTIRAGNLGVSPATLNVKIPHWANSFIVVDDGGVPPAPPNLSLFVNRAGSVQASYLYTDRSNLGQQHENTYPIPNGCDVLVIQNNDPINAPQNVNVIFNLAL